MSFQFVCAAATQFAICLSEQWRGKPAATNVRVVPPARRCQGESGMLVRLDAFAEITGALLGGVRGAIGFQVAIGDAQGATGHVRRGQQFLA